MFAGTRRARREPLIVGRQERLDLGFREHLRTPLTGTSARWAFIRFAGGNVVYAAAIGVAFLSPLASLIVSGLVAVYYVFEHTPAPAQGPAGKSEAPSGPEPYDR